jgi:CheY-like chemotaxis protein
MEQPPTTPVPAVVPSLSAGPFELLAGRILVVEDDALNQNLICRMLEKHGLKGTVAADGAAAVDFAERESWDLILMDCQLPGMDGFEATRLIRAGKMGRKIPIVALTANSETEVRVACAQAGMDDFLAKPVRRAELHACLKKWLGNRSAGGPA